jgi:SPX domain protein involved in polyphosphate accumulation
LIEKLAEAQRKFETLRNDLMDISESFESKLKKSKKLINKTSTFEDDQEDEDLVKNLIESSEPINNENIRKRKSINVDNNLTLTSARAIENDNIDEKNLIGFLSGQSFAQRFLEKNKLRQLKQKKYRKEHDLKLAFSEFYLSLILLQNYQTLNFTGFRKILKKHDKVNKRLIYLVRKSFVAGLNK